jgi:hypothetical protein
VERSGAAEAAPFKAAYKLHFPQAVAPLFHGDATSTVIPGAPDSVKR